MILTKAAIILKASRFLKHYWKLIPLLGLILAKIILGIWLWVYIHDLKESNEDLQIQLDEARAELRGCRDNIHTQNRMIQELSSESLLSSQKARDRVSSTREEYTKKFDHELEEFFQSIQGLGIKTFHPAGVDQFDRRVLEPGVMGHD